MAHNTDVFLSHNWGKDELGRDNHARVSCINKELQKYGYLTWFDEEQIKGEIVNQIADGIQGAQGVIIFITKRYHDKVTGKRANDNCKLEFDFAARTKTDKLLAVVMERDMRNISKWTRSVDLYLGGKMFIDMSGDFSNQAYIRQNMKLLQERLHFLKITPSNTINSTYANTKQPTDILVFVLLGSALAELSYIKNLEYL